MRNALPLAFVCLTLPGCSGSGVTGPTTPPAPGLSCPADVAAVARTGQSPPAVSFQTPVATDGQPPVTVVCTPGPGSIFQLGTTRVSCEATDAMRRTARCTFSVVVSPAPRLSATRFLAFGDSLTEGKVSLGPSGVLVIPGSIFNVPGSYPDRLNTKLTDRYIDQTVTVIADGLGNESASDAAKRLPGQLNFHLPDAMLLLSGVNQILQTPSSLMPAAIEDATSALRTMVQYAKSRGVRVYLATLLPVGSAGRRPEEVAAVPVLNDRIRGLATAEGVTLVDLYAVVPLSMIGRDSVHPRAEAYEVIADEWFKAIRATMEVK